MKLDAISIALTMLALLFSVYLSLWTESKDLALFPTVLLFSGLFMTLVSGRKLEHDTDLSRKEASNIFFYVLIALAAIGMVSLVSSRIFIPQHVAALTGLALNYLAVLLAVAEEMFFRGGLLSFLQVYLRNDLAAILANSGVFTVYHFAVYQNPQALVFVFGAGVVLAWVAVRTDRLSPSCIAHVINNLMATGIIGGA